MAYALKFSGSPDLVSFGLVLDTYPIVSAVLWMQITNTPSANSDLIWGWGNKRWFFIHSANSVNFRFSIIIGGIEKTTGNTTFSPSLNTWYMAVGTYDPNGGSNNLTLRVYDENGTLKESLASTQVGGMDPIHHALQTGHDSERNFYWKGIVQLQKIYSGVLTVTEQNNLALFLDPSRSDLIGKLDYNEGSGTVIRDQSGLGNNGVITGSTWVTTGIGTTTSTSTSTTTTTTSTSTSTSTTSTSTSTSTTTTWPYKFSVDGDEFLGEGKPTFNVDYK